MIAAREYDDPNEWVRIAEANDLDDPREIAPGDWLTAAADRESQWNWQHSLSRYGDFYAPAFAVRVGRNDLMRDLFARGEPGRSRPGARRGVAVQLHRGRTAYSQKLARLQDRPGADVLSLLKFGAEVDICMGYGDAKSVAADRRAA